MRKNQILEESFKAVSVMTKAGLYFTVEIKDVNLGAAIHERNSPFFFSQRYL